MKLILSLTVHLTKTEIVYSIECLLLCVPNQNVVKCHIMFCAATQVIQVMSANMKDCLVVMQPHDPDAQ